MATELPISAIIVDENDLQRGGLRSYLEAEADIVVVGDFKDLSAAVGVAGELQPKVVLLSMSLPDVGLFTACRRIAAAVPHTRIIALGSSPLDAEEVGNAMMAGASGLLPRDAPRSDFVRVVRANGRGDMLLTAAVAEITLRATQVYMRDVNLGRLTPRERQVLVLVSNGLGNAAIATELGITAHTVRKHVSHALLKLGVSKRAELGAYAFPATFLGNDDGGDR